MEPYAHCIKLNFFAVYCKKCWCFNVCVRFHFYLMCSHIHTVCMLVIERVVHRERVGLAELALMMNRGKDTANRLALQGVKCSIPIDGRGDECRVHTWWPVSWTGRQGRRWAGQSLWSRAIWPPGEWSSRVLPSLRGGAFIATNFIIPWLNLQQYI